MTVDGDKEFQKLTNTGAKPRIGIDINKTEDRRRTGLKHHHQRSRSMCRSEYLRPWLFVNDVQQTQMSIAREFAATNNKRCPGASCGFEYIEK